MDGLLKPGGPTITAIGGLFGGAKPQDKPPFPVDSTDPGKGVWIDEWPRGGIKPTPPYVPTPIPKIGQDAPAPAPDQPGGDIWEKPQPTKGGQDDLEALIRIMTGGQKPTPADTSPRKPVEGVDYIEIHGINPAAPPIRVPLPRVGSTSNPPDLFPGHTISEAGAREHEDWAKLLKRDAKPEETARILNVAITDHGDQGAADAADLLGRFAQHDPQKAETLRTLVSRQAGRDVPFRIAPLGEGFREPSMEEKLAQAPQSPFGPIDGADMEAAGSMAKALLKKGDYQDAYAYLKSAPEATPPYMAAVHDFMRQENPALAMKFAEQGVQNGMAKPVQVAQAETGTKTDAVPASAPPAPAPTPPEAKPPETNPQAPTPQPTAPEPSQAPATPPVPSSPAEPSKGETRGATNPNQGSAGNKADWEALQKPAGVAEEDWTGFKDSLRNNKTLNDHERYSFLMTFGHEGGAKQDDNGGGPGKPSSAGLTQATIKGFKDKTSGFPADVSKLTMDQRVTLYQLIADEALKTDKTGVRLEGLKDPKAAAQFFDVYFQHSAGTRPALIQKGLNQTITDLPEDVRKKLDLKPVEVRGDVGTMTRGALFKLIENGYGDKVRANIAKQRDAHFGGKPTGNNQVRIDSTR